jgi:hypothetical protein
MKRKKVASADDDVIAEEILEWSGCEELWNEHELDEEFSVVEDVLERCMAAEVNTRNWDGGAPGRSGVWHTVWTTDPDALKTEIRARIEALIASRG